MIILRRIFTPNTRGQEVTIEIDTGKVAGHINPRALGLVQEWRQLHLAELAEDWRLAQQKRILKTIQPLE